MERSPVPADRDMPEGENAEVTRVDPMMEAPDVSSSSSGDAASWNPAQGDRSFGYGSGGGHSSRREPGTPGGQSDVVEDAP